jgi:hypothetical protein
VKALNRAEGICGEEGICDEWGSDWFGSMVLLCLIFDLLVKMLARIQYVEAIP